MLSLPSATVDTKTVAARLVDTGTQTVPAKPKGDVNRHGFRATCRESGLAYWSGLGAVGTDFLLILPFTSFPHLRGNTLANLTSVPQPLRTASAVDGALPTSPTANGCVKAAYYDRIKFYIDLTGSASVVPCWIDDGGKWYEDVAQTTSLTGNGQFLLDVPVQGAYCFLKVKTLTGTTPSAVISYSLSKTRNY